MKTRNFKKAMSVCLFVCVLCLVASMNEVKSQNLTQSYYYDCARDVAGKLTQTICVPDASGTYLKPHLKYFFTYDEAGRVVTKEARRWDASSNTWQPGFCLLVHYEDTVVTVDYAGWNKKEEAYNSHKERAVYTIQDEEVVAYVCFKQAANANDWILVTNITELQLDPVLILGKYLLASSDSINL